MEPPAKRRRMSQWLLDKETADEDDDELAFRPFEVKAKKDPDYKLSVERAYADQRFQATMAHIFEKYGRDFDGIGDEIDLVTGEIVVNNGHVRNMRDEGDVGDGLGGDLADGEDDEDEGILLEDLLDDDEDYGDEEAGEQRRHVDFGKEAQNGDGTDEDEEDRIMQGREVSRDSHSTALVLGSSSGNALSVSRTVARISPYVAHKETHLRFESPTELPFAQSPFSFDRSPFVTEPWGFHGQYSDPLWGQSDIFAVHQPPKQQLPMTPSRYNFPAQSGQTSIWAPRSKFRDDEDEPLQSAFTATFGKHLLTKRRKILRHPLLLPSTKSIEGVDNRREEEEGEGEEEEDEDVILTGKRSKEMQNIKATSARPTKHSGDLHQPSSLSRKEAEDRGGEGTSSDSGYKSVESARRGRKRKQRPSEEFVRNEASANPSDISRRASNPQPKKLSHNARETEHNTPLIELPGETDGRRRSGRMRKQVEFLDKISWAEVLAERRAENQAMWHSHPSQSSFDHEFEGAEGSPEPVLGYEEQRAMAELDNDCIPDSADEEEEDEDGEARNSIPPIDLSTSHESEVPQSDFANHSRTQAPAGFPRKNVDSGCILSDDEAPTLLSKPRKSVSGNAPKGILPLREIHNVKTQAKVTASSSDASREKPSTLSRRERMSTQDVIMNTPPTARKSSAEHLGIPSEDSSGVAPLSSSPTRFLSRITLNVSLDDTPQPSNTPTKKARHQHVAIPPSSPCDRISEDTPKATASPQKKRQPKRAENQTTAITIIEDSSYETFDDFSPTESSPLKARLQAEPTLPSPRRTTSPPVAVNRAATQSPSKVPSTLSPMKSPPERPLQSTEAEKPLLSLSNPPQTPRRHNRHSLKAPSSRHSILSLLSDDEDEEIDELGGNLAAMPKLLSSAAQTTARKVWKSSSRTREVYHTPVKKRPSEPVSPGSIIKTPGGTLRACGLDGYRCGRDFCFTCL
ncbi:hypothetical protein V8C42DRAFT_330200 [Trichoderma barbatum]